MSQKNVSAARRVGRKEQQNRQQADQGDQAESVALMLRQTRSSTPGQCDLPAPSSSRQ